MRLILASSSPRRKEILQKIYKSFEIITCDVDESVDENLGPGQLVMELAQKKAQAVAETNRDAFVIGSDTIVYHHPQVLGKPKDKQDAKQMLQLLSGQTHSVYTGVAVVKGDERIQFFEKTDVKFWELTEEEIDTYIETGEPFDKAGAYGIQDIGSILVESIHGDFFAVMGLPIARLFRTLKKMGYEEEKRNRAIINDSGLSKGRETP